MMRWKGRLPAGTVYANPVISLDLLPTALSAAGGAVEEGWRLDGVNLLPFVGAGGAAGAASAETGGVGGAPHEALFWRMGEKRAVRRGEWKLAAEVGQPRFSLYNLTEDVGEERNLAAVQPKTAAELENLWQEWNAELAEPRWKRTGGRPARRNPARRRASTQTP
jgi:arylsulfatase A-like enzyme